MLTGETGAGKSIILDALHAITGGRSSRELIRTGQSKACVRALFGELSPQALRILEDNGIPAEDGCVLLSRELYADGRNLCRAGGRPCALSLLRELGAELVSIHGQHDGRELLDPTRHLGYLDSFADTAELLADYRGAYAAAKALHSRLVALEQAREERARRLEVLRYQIGELEAAALCEGEQEGLIARRTALENAARIRASLSAAAGALAGENAASATALLGSALRALVDISPLSAEAAAAADRAAELVGSAEELAGQLSLLLDGVREDAAELAEVRERLELVRRLCAKYGGSEAAACSFLHTASAEAETLAAAESEADTLSTEYTAALTLAREAAARLSERRKEAAARLEAAVEAELAYLEMPGCRLQARFADSSKLSLSGTDKMEFYLSPNPGEDPKPLSRIASGGELSRIMLALRNVLVSGQGRTLVFDEIDTGVSGRAAQRVGEKLYGAARRGQVLCVTHLSQIAAMGDTHFSVCKTVQEGRTLTLVRPLDEEGRARELARINGGFRITDTLLAGAREALRAAEEYKTTCKGR